MKTDIPEGHDFVDAPMLNTEDVSSAVLYCIATPVHVAIHELTIKPLREKV